MSELREPFFGDDAAVIVKLTEWMEWSSGKADASRNVVLPMIQRGSVWPPHKLLDFWDTLLRGMPVGALMASEAAEGSVKVLGEAQTRVAKTTDIGLIDGQQRTLAMLVGWPKGLENPLRPVALWVDLADDPQGEYRFRLWATTKAQPFGYARASMGGQALSKLERKKLRLANQVFNTSESENKIDVQILWRQSDFMPWEAKFALPLTELIEHKGKLLEFVKGRLTDYRKALEKKAATSDSEQHFANKLRALPHTEDAALAQGIALFEKALDKLFVCKFPVINVRKECFDDSGSGSGNTNTDPALAILFKRVGTGGEPLSNADYVYSVIKHYAPQVHGMVEELLKDEKVRAIYTPTTLVMSAVRLTMLSLANTGSDADAHKFTDTAKLDKAAFARMVRNHPGFMSAFDSHIQPDGGTFVTSLNDVLNSISYAADIGLPKHALCLVQIPLLETLLAWHTLTKPLEEILKRSRLAMVRFVLQGYLCVLDYAKASEVAIKALKDMKAVSPSFPDQALMAILVDDKSRLAYPLPSPATLSEIKDLTVSSKETNGLRGWTRFYLKDEPDKQQYAELYKRWWNRTGRHTHPLLLWLQREYVFDKFEAEPALAGMDEETPFDFDHILPSAQWANWTGNGGNNRFIDFPLKDPVDHSGHRCIGNSIGNIHVLDSSENRSWGDKSVHDKLEIENVTKHALIEDNQKENWMAASGAGAPRHWDIERARSFQEVVEQRTFAMYQKFYEDLRCGDVDPFRYTQLPAA